MEVIQILLRRPTATGGINEMVTWLPVAPGIKKGATIMLKDDGGTWTIAATYTKQDTDGIQHGWGLDLPKSIRTER